MPLIGEFCQYAFLDDSYELTRFYCIWVDLFIDCGTYIQKGNKFVQIYLY